MDEDADLGWSAPPKNQVQVEASLLGSDSGLSSHKCLSQHCPPHSSETKFVSALTKAVKYLRETLL